METREFEVRLTDGETRTVAGIAVPYGDTISVGGYSERFERGAFGDIADTKLFYGHKEPIGRVVRGEDTDAGFMIEAVISDTVRGNEVHTLLRDGVLNKFSVGFEAVEDRMDDGVVVRTKALFSFERMTCISWANSGEERCSASCIRTSSARCEKRAEGNAVCVDGRRSWRAGE